MATKNISTAYSNPYFDAVWNYVQNRSDINLQEYREKILKATKAEVNAQHPRHHGWTAQHNLVHFGNAMDFKVLLTSGGCEKWNLSAVNYNNETPLDIASNREELEGVLREHCPGIIPPSTAGAPKRIAILPSDGEDSCTCIAGYDGQNCDQCTTGYHGYPDCVAGSTSDPSSRSDLSFRSNPSSRSSEDENNNGNVATIAGSVGGTVLFAIILVFILFFFIYNRGRKKPRAASKSDVPLSAVEDLVSVSRPTKFKPTATSRVSNFLKSNSSSLGALQARARVVSVTRATEPTEVFLTHTWQEDELGRNTHQRVSIVNQRLKEAGLKTWFDEDRMSGHIVDKMAEGIDGTKVVLVFITRKYMQKLKSPMDENCKSEFNYAVKQKGTGNMIPIVMEPCMKNTTAWKGTLGFRIGDHLHIDMSDDESMQRNMDKLVSDIRKHLE